MLQELRRWLDRACGALSALALFAIMWLTLADVTGRKLLASSVPGSLETTELLMVLVIFAALPLVSLRAEHVVFDSLDPLLEEWVRKAQGLVVEIGSCAILAGVAWVVWSKAAEMSTAGDVTLQLGIPLGPFVYLMAVLIGLTGIVHLLHLVVPVKHHHPGVVEDEGAAS